MNMKKTLKWTGITVLLMILAAVGFFGIQMTQYKDAMERITFSHIDINAVPNGTYEGSCDAVIVSAKVSVAVKDGTITDIQLLEHNNGKGAPAESTLNLILKDQTTDVDTISGATNSSKVIRKAVENALLQQ
jgi:uncharacterized protein with FMN-binding domain